MKAGDLVNTSWKKANGPCRILSVDKNILTVKDKDGTIFKLNKFWFSKIKPQK